ncbi:hypothetical protein B0H67DRAFT_557994 [Lasiosphaeris hirsuta]|uniref:ER-bound oxygenase mpaB/mpaB'/Rubber oxygenase catalytic domain-containing protein n=1 Tax=Lasiosphaeris hirsuta TaxID=260670 RepID=A0AA39ZXB6_9PEZI|nr:hypothetical protein B0H67DRAFT_557994 [Lasiosphaeris hirsuta]
MGLFSPNQENSKRVWGYEFEWTVHHLTPEQMCPLMFSYDKLADDCLDRFDELTTSLDTRSITLKDNGVANPDSGTDPSSHPPPDGKEKKKGCPHPDYYTLLRNHHSSDPTLDRLWTEVTTVPDWVDWTEIERGQKVFYRYAGPATVALTFHSLLGGMGSRRVVETLARTGGFGINVARRRLLETFQHILDVTQSIGSIQPPGVGANTTEPEDSSGPGGKGEDKESADIKERGKGFASTLRVRFLHASVRRRILRLARESPSYYSVEKHGIPISDLDCIGTALTFSAALIFISLPRQGIHLTPAETTSYLALWRYIAHLLGTPTTLLSTPTLAKATLESLIISEISPTPTSALLANNIITSLAHRAPTFASAAFLRAETHWLNGRELADALGVPRPPWYYTAMVAWQCLFFMAVSYGRRAAPGWDAKGRVRVKGILRRFTGEILGGEARFGFVYVPAVGKGTVGEGAEVEGWMEGGIAVAVVVALMAVGWAVWACAGGSAFWASGLFQKVWG